MRRTLVTTLALFGAAGAAAVAVAQDAPRRRPLHEDLPAPAAGDSPLVGDAPREGKNPAAFAAGDKVLPAPKADPTRADEPVLGRGGFAADRQTETRPDYDTGPDGTLRYASVFNPDVLPFKRMTALDAIRPDYTLHVQHTATYDVPVGGQTTPDRDRFWGSVAIELAPGREVALPSVAPDMRILSYETTPPVALTFSRDGADNFYVRSDEASARGTYRLVFLVDADAGYFAPAFPRRALKVADVRARAQAEGLLPALPPAVLAEARVSLAALEIKDGSPLEEAFDRLVAWHRSFEAKPLRGGIGDVYRDLFDNRAGVCRHRSFTFLVTALAAGIPTRYVTNEAHAFVEVWFPGRGWQRVDLGGAALRMEVTGAEGKTLHRPRAEDPFAKPQEYDQSYTQLEGDIRGLTSQQLAQRRGGGAPSGHYDPLVAGDDDAAGDPARAGAADDAVGPGDDAPPRAADPAKRHPHVTITYADDQGYRGEAVRVDGIVRDGAGPIANLRVDVWVAPAGAGGNGAVLVGRGATDHAGRFAVDADLPADLDLRTYEVFATTPETASHNAGRSD